MGLSLPHFSPAAPQFALLLPINSHCSRPPGYCGPKPLPPFTTVSVPPLTTVCPPCPPHYCVPPLTTVCPPHYCVPPLTTVCPSHYCVPPPLLCATPTTVCHPHYCVPLPLPPTLPRARSSETLQVADVEGLVKGHNHRKVGTADVGGRVDDHGGPHHTGAYRCQALRH